MRALIRLAALAITAFVIVGGASSAKQLNLNSYGASPQTQLPRPPHRAQLCFWRENNGTPLGISGNCAASAASALGSACTCMLRLQSGKFIYHHGTVIAAPETGPASNVN